MKKKPNRTDFVPEFMPPENDVTMSTPHGGRFESRRPPNATGTRAGEKPRRPGLES